MNGRTSTAVTVLLLSVGSLLGAKKEATTFKSYVDSDICSHLYAGPLTQTRMACSEDTHKQGSNPVLVRLQDSWVFQVNKDKMIAPLVGKVATADGEVNYGNSTMKLKSVEPLAETAIPAAERQKTILDVRHNKANPGLYERVRHELALMPYITYFDFISFTLNGSEVVLTGWTTRETNRSEAFNRVKQVEGVETVVNNLTVTPLSTMDNRIRSAALAALQRSLSRYFWGNGSAIKIVVKNGDIILLGVVHSKEDSDIAALRCSTITSAFHIFNMLQVESSGGTKQKKERGD